MNFALDLMMMKSMNKNDGKALSTIYDIDGDNLFCLNGDAAIKYYETVNFLKENNKEPTLENVRRVLDIFLKEYDPFFRLLSTKKYTQSYVEHIEKLKKKRLMQVLMESAGFVYMAYQIFNSMKKLGTNSKLKYIPLIGLVLYVLFNIFNAYYANYTKKEYNIIKAFRPRLNDISGNVYVQIPEIEKINSKASSLYYEMLKNKLETIINYVENPTINKKVNNKINLDISENKIVSDDADIGIEMSKLEEIERKVVPSAFTNKSDLIMEDVANVNAFSTIPELFPQESIVIEIESKSDEKSVHKENEKENDNDNLSVTEEILEEIQKENEQENKQENKQDDLISVKKEEEKVQEVNNEQPKRKGRQSTKAKVTKQTKTKQNKTKQQNKKK